MYKLIVLKGGYEWLSTEWIPDFGDLKQDFLFTADYGVEGCPYDGAGEPLWRHRPNLEAIIEGSSTWEELVAGLSFLFDDVEKKEGAIIWPSDTMEGVEIRIERE